jgi:hypothetical protein
MNRRSAIKTVGNIIVEVFLGTIGIGVFSACDPSEENERLTFQHYLDRDFVPGMKHEFTIKNPQVDPHDTGHLAVYDSKEVYAQAEKKVYPLTGYLVTIVNPYTNNDFLGKQKIYAMGIPTQDTDRPYSISDYPPNVLQKHVEEKNSLLHTFGLSIRFKIVQKCHAETPDTPGEKILIG